MAFVLLTTVLAGTAIAGEETSGGTGGDPTCDEKPEECKPVDCDRHPSAPECRPDCDERPGAPGCQPDCEKDPTAPGCEPDCDADPTAPGCNQAPVLDGCEAIEGGPLPDIEWTTEPGTVVGVAIATDPDGDELTFSGSDADGSFAVESDGQVVVASDIAPPDPAAPVDIEITVTVSDGELEATETCVVTVLPIEVAGSTIDRIYASAPVGTVVFSPGFEDFESWSFNWSFAGDAADFFTADAVTGELTVTAPLPRPEAGNVGADREVLYEFELDATGPGIISEFVVEVLVVDFFDDDNPGVYGDAAAYEDAINWLGDPIMMSHSPITSGCGKGTPWYCPEDPTTRGHIAVFMTRLWALVDESGGADAIENQFADTADHRFRLFINTLFQEGITNGCGFDAAGELIYCPDDALEWGEAAMMIRRAFARFTDTSLADLATQGEALEWLADAGYTQGILAADLCESAACQDEEIGRGATALLLRNVWDMSALGDT